MIAKVADPKVWKGCLCCGRGVPRKTMYIHAGWLLCRECYERDYMRALRDSLAVSKPTIQKK